AEDVLRAERLARERRDDRGVNAAGESEHGALKAVLARIISDAEDERAADGLDVIAGQTRLVAHAAVQVNGSDELLEGRRLKDGAPAAVGDERSAVEDDAVVAADEVDVNHGQPRRL